VKTFLIDFENNKIKYFYFKILKEALYNYKANLIEEYSKSIGFASL